MLHTVDSMPNSSVMRKLDDLHGVQVMLTLSTNLARVRCSVQLAIEYLQSDLHMPNTRDILIGRTKKI